MRIPVSLIVFGMLVSFTLGLSFTLIQSKPKSKEPEPTPVAIHQFKDGWNVIVEGKTYYIPPRPDIKTEQPEP